MENRQNRILFIAEAVTLAHVARVFTLANSLDRNTYEILIACDPRYKNLFSSYNIPTKSIYTISSNSFSTALEKGTPIYKTTTLEKYVTEDLKLIDDFKPDVVVGDFRISLAISATKSQIPYITLTNAYWSPFAEINYPVPDIPITKIFGAKIAQTMFDIVRPFVFSLHTKPLNKVFKKFGLPDLGSDLRNTYTWANHVIYADLPEMVSMKTLPSNHHFIGPVLWSPSIPLPKWWDELNTEKPIIYLNLGSSGKKSIIPQVLDWLSELDANIVCATASDNALQTDHNNVFISSYLPGDKVCERAAVVICNGGSPTTYQALSKGVPILGIPHNLDQFLNMQGILKFNAGLQLRTNQIKRTLIQSSITALLDNHIYREQAIKLKKEVEHWDSSTHFQRLIDKIIKSSVV